MKLLAFDPDAMPAVSVLIPAYNAATTIGPTLTSVYAQDYPGRVEVIVVDDGSVDDTAAIISRDFPTVKLLRQPNSGIYRSRNAAAASATGDYFAFLDADDLWHPDKLTMQIAAIQAHPEYDFVTSSFDWLYPDGRVKPGVRGEGPEFIPLTLENWVRSRFQWATGIASQPSGWLLKRTVYETLGGMDERAPMMEDWEFLVRLLRAGHRAGVITRPLFTYRYSLTSVSHAMYRRNQEAGTEYWLNALQRLQEVFEPAVYEDIVFDELRIRARAMIRYGYLANGLPLLRRACTLKTVSFTRRLRLWPQVVGVAILRACLGPRSKMLYNLRSGLRQLKWRLRAHRTVD